MMKNRVYLKKNIKLSEKEKQQALENNICTKNIDIYDNIEDLYLKYYKKTNISSYKNFLCYHEFVQDNNSILCLFLDIDINKTTLITPIESLIKIYDIKKKVNNNPNISDLYLLECLVESFCSFLYENNNKYNYSIKYILKDEFIDFDEINISYEKFKKFCYKNIGITKNINEDKYSYHVYIKNILFNNKDISVIKDIIKIFISKEKINPFVSGLDTIIYKKNLSLRILYTKKNNDTDVIDNFHYPLKTYIENNELKIIQEEEEITVENLEKYFCTVNDTVYNKKKYFYIHKIETDTDSASENENKELSLYKEVKNSPNLEFLTLKDILTLIFKPYMIVFLELVPFLENLYIFNSDTLYKDYLHKNHELTLNFNYSYHKCVFCKKRSHKNKHYIVAGFYGVNIIKQGNQNNCKIFSRPYETMTEVKICEYIYKDGVVKKTLDNDIIYFTENKGWCYLENNMYSGIKHMMKNYSKNFRTEEIKLIDNMTDKKIKEYFLALTHNDEQVSTIYPYMFKFNNGILDMKTDNFIKLKNSKHIYLVIGVSYDYIDLNNYNDEQMKKFIFLNEIIDQIIPPLNETGEINYYREIFETNVSSCLIKEHKDVITVFEGPTLAGKSTVKHLICSSLGDKDNFIDLPIIIYANPIDPRHPDPWLGQIAKKCASFASEPGFEKKINTQTIKLLTEPKVLSRKLFSNDTGQINFLTQFIDTNFTLKFDAEDAAVYRRWAVIKFTSHFQTPDEDNLLVNDLNTNISNKYTQIKSLKRDILKNIYCLDFFHILYIWFKKHHINEFKMKHTASISPFYMLNECINNMTLPGCVVNPAFIKEEKLENYANIKIRINFNQTKNIIGINKKYFKNYFNKFLIYKKIDYDLNKLVSKLIVISNSKAILPFVLIDDIKSENIDKVIEYYKKITHTKNNSGKNFNLTYYNNNKFIFEIDYEAEENKNISDNMFEIFN